MESENKSEILARLYLKMIKESLNSQPNSVIDENEFIDEYFEKLSATKFYHTAKNIKFPLFYKKRNSLIIENPYKSSVNLFIKLYYECPKICKCEICSSFKYQKYFISSLKVRQFKPRTFCRGRGFYDELLSKKTMFFPSPQEFFIICTEKIKKTFKLSPTNKKKFSNFKNFKKKQPDFDPSEENFDSVDIKLESFEKNYKSFRNNEQEGNTEKSFLISEEFYIAGTNCWYYRYSAVWMIIFEQGSATSARKINENEWLVDKSAKILKFSEVSMKNPVIVVYKRNQIKLSMRLDPMISTAFITCMEMSQFYSQEFKENLENIENFKNFVFNTLGFIEFEIFIEIENQLNSFYYFSNIVLLLKSLEQKDVKLFDFILNFPKIRPKESKNFVWLVDDFEELLNCKQKESVFIHKNKKELFLTKSLCIIPSLKFEKEDLSLQKFLTNLTFSIKFKEFEKTLDLTLLIIKCKKTSNVHSAMFIGTLLGEARSNFSFDLIILKLGSTKNKSIFHLISKKNRVIAKENYQDYEVICVFYEDSYNRKFLNIPPFNPSEMAIEQSFAFSVDQFFFDDNNLLAFKTHEKSGKPINTLFQMQKASKDDLYLEVNNLKQFKVILSFIGNSLKAVLGYELSDKEIHINESYEKLCKFSSKFFYNYHSSDSDSFCSETLEMLSVLKVSPKDEKVKMFQFFNKILLVLGENKASVFNNNVFFFNIEVKNIDLNNDLQKFPNYLGVILCLYPNQGYEREATEILLRLNEYYYSVSIYIAAYNSNDFKMILSEEQAIKYLSLKKFNNADEICLVFTKINENSFSLAEKILENNFFSKLVDIDKITLKKSINPYPIYRFKSINSFKVKENFKLTTPELLDRVIHFLVNETQTKKSTTFLNQSGGTQVYYKVNEISENLSNYENFTLNKSYQLISQGGSEILMSRSTDDCIFLHNSSPINSDLLDYNSRIKENRFISIFDGNLNYLKFFQSFDNLNTSSAIEVKSLADYSLLFFYSIRDIKLLQKFETEKIKFRTKSKTLEFLLSKIFFMSGSKAKIIDLPSTKNLRETLEAETSGKNSCFLLVFKKVVKSTLMLYENLDHLNLCYMNSAFINLGNIQSFRNSMQDLIEFLDQKSEKNSWIKLVPFDYKNNEMKTKLQNMEKFRMEFDRMTNFFVYSDKSSLQNNERFINELLSRLHEISEKYNHDELCPVCKNFFSEYQTNDNGLVKSYFIEINAFKPKFYITTDRMDDISLSSTIYRLNSQPKVIYMNLNYPPKEYEEVNIYKAAQHFIETNKKIPVFNHGVHLEFQLIGLNLYHRSTHYKALIFKKSRGKWLLINDDLLEKKFNKIEDFKFSDEKCLTYSIFYSLDEKILCPYITNLYLLQVSLIFEYKNDANLYLMKQIVEKKSECLDFQDFFDFCFDQLHFNSEIFRSKLNNEIYLIKDQDLFKLPSQIDQLLNRNAGIHDINDQVDKILLWFKGDSRHFSIDDHLDSFSKLFDEFQLKHIFEIKKKSITVDPCLSFNKEVPEEIFSTIHKSFDSTQFSSSDQFAEEKSSGFNKNFSYLDQKSTIGNYNIYRKLKTFKTKDSTEKYFILKYLRPNRNIDKKLIILKILDYMKIFKDLLKHTQEEYKELKIPSDSKYLKKILKKIKIQISEDLKNNETNLFLKKTQISKKLKDYKTEDILTFLETITEKNHKFLKGISKNSTRKVFEQKESDKFIFSIFTSRIYLENSLNKKLYFFSELNEVNTVPDVLVYFNNKEESWKDFKMLQFLIYPSKFEKIFYSCKRVVVSNENSEILIIKTSKNSIKFSKSLIFDENFKSRYKPVMQIFLKIMKTIFKPQLRVKKTCRVCGRKYPSNFSTCRKKRCENERLS